MNKITIYTTNSCTYCVKAKNLLDQKNLNYEEINVESKELREKMKYKTGGRYTVPQIFIDNNYIGGYEDLYLYMTSNKN